jgi:hypothetical protein
MNFFRACSDQTSNFQWSLLYQSVAVHLGRREQTVADPIPPVLLRGGLTMFPIVQTLPEDRKVEIVATGGICALVIWAHHILGLNVIVTGLYGGENPRVARQVVFGTGPEQVIIQAADFTNSQLGGHGYDAVSEYESFITLFESSLQDQLFTLEADDMDRRLESSYKYTDKGIRAEAPLWRNRFTRSWRWERGHFAGNDSDELWHSIGSFREA